MGINKIRVLQTVLVHEKTLQQLLLCLDYGDTSYKQSFLN